MNYPRAFLSRNVSQIGDGISYILLGSFVRSKTMERAYLYVPYVRARVGFETQKIRGHTWCISKRNAPLCASLSVSRVRRFFFDFFVVVDTPSSS